MSCFQLHNWSLGWWECFIYLLHYFKNHIASSTTVHLVMPWVGNFFNIITYFFSQVPDVKIVCKECVYNVYILYILSLYIGYWHGYELGYAGWEGWPAAGCLFVFKIGVVGVGAVPLLLGGVLHLPHHLQQRMHAYVEEEGFIIQKISQSSSLLSGEQYWFNSLPHYTDLAPWWFDEMDE